MFCVARGPVQISILFLMLIKLRHCSNLFLLDLQTCSNIQAFNCYYKAQGSSNLLLPLFLFCFQSIFQHLMQLIEDIYF
jgi:hypothetical protein